MLMLAVEVIQKHNVVGEIKYSPQLPVVKNFHFMSYLDCPKNKLKSSNTSGNLEFPTIFYLLIQDDQQEKSNRKIRRTTAKMLNKHVIIEMCDCWYPRLTNAAALVGGEPLTADMLAAYLFQKNCGRGGPHISF